MASLTHHFSSASFLPASTKTPARRHRLAGTISCRANKKGDFDGQGSILFGGGRADLLISLGGLYGANRSAIAASIQPPYIAKCSPIDIPQGGAPTNYYLPTFNSEIKDFVLPPHSTALRVRPAAHLVDYEYLMKYTKAVERMRALPADDPRNFIHQANIHSAYYHGAYDQIGIPSLDIEVFNSWLFFPWHRMYLYFYVRILGKLVGDETFAIPFWNWDAPEGMQVPSFCTDKTSSQHNKRRDPAHQPTMIIDFDGNPDPRLTKDQVIQNNLKIIYRQIMSNGKTASLFLGAPHRAGDQPSPGSGSIEQVLRGPVRIWIEDTAECNGGNMGSFYSSNRDFSFSTFHGNVDRMWSLWKNLRENRQNFTDDEWLQAAFYFYDENAQLVRVRVKDCLETEKLGYTYQTGEVPWQESRPEATERLLQEKASAKAPIVDQEPVFPIMLEKAVRATVKREKKGRSKEEEEVLLVEGIEVDRAEFVKFDVYINAAEEENMGPSEIEFAGSFVNLPQNHGHGKKGKKLLKTNLRLGITDLLEDLQAEDDEGVVVTLVPKTQNGKKVKVAGLRIEFHS